MKRKDLEQLISESVQEILFENKKRVTAKKVSMNEAQMKQYVQRIINEELENEGFWSGIKGVANQFGQDIKNYGQKMKQTYKNNAAAGDLQKLLQQMNQYQQNYAQILPPGVIKGFNMAKKSLEQVAMGLQQGSVNVGAQQGQPTQPQQ